MTVIVNDASVKIDRLALGPWGTNAYIVTCPETQASLVVDAPGELPRLLAALEGTQPAYILITHSHGDHTGALAALHSALKVPLVAHPADAGRLPISPDELLQGGEVLTLGKLEIGVRHTPGHTPGSLCFVTGKYLLAGDTIFPDGPGKTGSPDAFRQIVASITEKIFTLPDDTQILPGHGAPARLGEEKAKYARFAARPHPSGLCGDVLWQNE